MKENMTTSRVALICCFLFLLISLIRINAPFTNASHERQYQTVEMGQSLIARTGATVWMPRAAFANYSHPEQEYTVVRLEVPFHAAFGALLARVTGEAPWVWRSISILASLLSIILATFVFCHFVPEGGGFLAGALFSSAPLLLHYGQVPMPDILCTLGMITSFAVACLFKTHKFYFKVILSALAFAAALLGKPSILPFALPICVFLFVPEDRRLEKKNFLPFCLWCAIALAPLLIWVFGSLHDPPGTMNLFSLSTHEQRGFPGDLRDPMFFVRVFSYLTLFGVGPLGFLLSARGLCFISKSKTKNLLIAALISILSTYMGMTRYMWREPQYTLPVLFWLSLFAAYGWMYRPRILRLKLVFACLGICQLMTLAWATVDLKSDRVPNHAELQGLTRFLDKNAKILQVSPSYGATPSGLLQRTTLFYVPRSTKTQESLDFYRKRSYTHVLFWDYTLRGNPLNKERRVVRARELEPELWNFAHSNLKLVYESEHVSLFALSPK